MERGLQKVNQHSRLVEWGAGRSVSEQRAVGKRMVCGTWYPGIHILQLAKPSVNGRKNFLFVNIPLGAQPNAKIYSLIGMAKETGVEPLRYLTWLLKTAPTLNRTVDGLVGSLLLVNAR